MRSHDDGQLLCGWWSLTDEADRSWRGHRRVRKLPGQTTPVSSAHHHWKLLTPERRRRAVVGLTERFGVSERRACRLAGQHRSSQRLAARSIPDAEVKLRRRLRSIARAHPRWGWKTAHTILRREGWAINRKRTQRLWRSEGLRRPVPCKRKRRRPAAGAELFRAERTNHVWALDFQFDDR